MKPPTVSLCLLALLTSCASAQNLRLPPRATNALTGSQLLPLIQGLGVHAREELLWDELTAGNVPGFARNFVEISRTRNDATGQSRSVTYWVAPDYVAIGADTDFFRMLQGGT